MRFDEAGCQGDGSSGATGKPGELERRKRQAHVFSPSPQTAFFLAKDEHGTRDQDAQGKLFVIRSLTSLFLTLTSLAFAGRSDPTWKSEREGGRKDLGQVWRPREGS